MTVTFQVGDREFGGSGNLEVDFWVRRHRSIISNLTRLFYQNSMTYTSSTWTTDSFKALTFVQSQGSGSFGQLPEA
jgi:hypothetical protein